MGSYKLIQDIEAEDHILGPLSLKQFIFFLVCAFCLYFVFLGATKKIWILLPIFIPPALVSGFFAFPFGRDQPTEVWALAKFRFLFKPRKRIWNQDGMKDMVTINAPKKVEKQLTKDLNQTEVQSRLKALANTLDTRGWAVKHAEQDENLQAGRLLNLETSTDYTDLVEGSTEDVFDEENSPLANHFGEMLNQQSTAKREALVATLQSSEPATSNQTTPPATTQQWFKQPSAPIAAPPTQNNPAMSNLRTIQPLGSQTQTTPPAKVKPEILQLANNNDLNISTIARQAAKQNQEVTVNLQ